MTLQIPDRIAQQIPLSESELLLEFAIFLYEQEILSMRAAAELSKISWVKMEQVLSERNIPIHYSSEELSKDLDNLKRLN